MAIQKRSLTVLECEAALELLHEQLSDKDASEMSMKLFSNLESKLSQRSNHLLLSALNFLHQPNIYALTANIKRFITDQYYRLYDEKKSTQESDVDDHDLPPRQAKQISLARCMNASVSHSHIIIDDSDDRDEKLVHSPDEQPHYHIDDTFQKKLHKRLSEIESSITEQPSSSDGAISYDLEMLKKTNQRTERINLLFSVLNSIPLTTINAERAFSSAQAIKTKVRNRMSDSTLDAIALLKNNRKYILPK
jgi:hypothetical protein